MALVDRQVSARRLSFCWDLAPQAQAGNARFDPQILRLFQVFGPASNGCKDEMRDSSLAAGTIASLLVVRFRFTLSRGQRPTRGASGPALTMARREHFGELVLDLCYRKAGDSLEVANVQCCDSIAEMQRRRANQQVLEGDAYTACRLFSLDASCKLRDLHGHGVHHHVAAEFFGKGSPPLAVRIALGPVDAVGQFDDSYNREGGVNFPLRSLHP